MGIGLTCQTAVLLACGGKMQPLVLEAFLLEPRILVSAITSTKSLVETSTWRFNTLASSSLAGFEGLMMADKADKQLQVPWNDLRMEQRAPLSPCSLPPDGPFGFLLR